MQSDIKKNIYIFLLLITGFLLNIIVYYFSEDYRFLLRTLKNDEFNLEVNDNYSLDQKTIESYSSWITETSLWMVEANLAKVKINSEEISIKLEMNEFDKKFLSLFSSYNLTKLESHSTLFNATDEYPDEYFEYYSPDLTIYLFVTKNYSEVKDIFNVVSSESNFKINEVNNFWEKSFFINFLKDFDDWKVRLILTKDNRVFGLKVAKSKYEEVKKILVNYK